jgi:flagellar capping protein FliD
MAEKIPGWIERLLLPKLSSLEGDLKAFRAEVTGEFKAVNGRIDSLEKQLSSLRNEINTRFDALESKVTLIEDVTRLKIEMKTLAEKVAAITTS